MTSDSVGFALPVTRMIQQLSGFIPAGVVGQPSGSTLSACSAGWMRSRRGTAQQMFVVLSVAQNISLDFLRLVLL
jgi:hypothetical protein